ncbi:malto-oligosyltrehalose trehalohydrolase [Cellulomonas sp. PhB143]|uniref:malto-oligosyltrehalose trehalohydrolase n=1 Tax=Cellulomonas sp. PhB143 TaxID=2485186 RepID=UPI000FBF5A71|nr:malto-oligosyltrehalose trehalohydrolase [Cellulomonas sp. PhB143]ROS78962.1 maltooligosyl trehalose hydrolase [Cellulomonas sp. PhB143]
MAGDLPPLAVWAPAAARVDLVLPAATDGSFGPRDAVVPLSAGEAGWWSAGADVPAGTDYAYSVDGGPPRPDPRSAHQPFGVDGPSRRFDPAFAWTDGAWAGLDARGAVTYELHVGTFTAEGTLDAAATHLDELAGLGVQMVELMPLAAFGGERGWGYDGVDLWAVHEAYGGPRALQRFVDAAHARGLGVTLDVVYNHLGPAGNYLSTFGPYFTDEHQTPWGSAVNLDQEGAAGVRAWVVQNALHWFDQHHVDALRLDAVHALIDDSPVHLLAELSARTAELADRLGRPLSLVAESDENQPATVTPLGDPAPPSDTAPGTAPRGMTAQWADDVHHAVHALVTGERHGYYADFGSVETLRTALTGAFVHAGTWSTFRGRRWGAPVPAGTDGHRFVVCASNHDQVGNRALGDRPAARLDVGGLAIEAALVLCSPFTPMLFMGEEWGASTPWQYFTDHQDPELGEAVRAGRRREFGGHGWTELYGGPIEVPDPQAASTRDASVLDRSEVVPGSHHARLRDWYATLVAVRAAVPDVGSGDLSAVGLERLPADGGPDADETSTLVLRRGAARVVLTLGSGPAQVPVPAGLRIVARWDDDARLAPDATLHLPGRSVVVLA